MFPSLPHSLRQLANRLPPDDAQVAWLAANQLDSFRTAMGELMSEEGTLQEARDRGERTRLLAVLIDVRGNRSWAADKLRISRAALYKVLRKHGLKPPKTR